MNRKMMSNFNLKPVISVIDMIKMLGLSRARFYQLIDKNIFPPPLYCPKSKRPFFTAELQQICLDIRESNIGYNGSYVLFYSPRKNSAVVKNSKSSTSVNEPISELTETLKKMKLDVDVQKVKKAMDELYPNGTDTNAGTQIRDLFRFFKSKGSE